MLFLLANFVSTKDQTKKLILLTDCLLEESFGSYAQTLLNQDHTLLGLILYRIKLSSLESNTADVHTRLFERLDGSSDADGSSSSSTDDLLSDSRDPCELISMALEARARHPERVVTHLSRFIETNFPPFTSTLAQLIHTHTANLPIILASVPGHDASDEAEILARNAKVSLMSVALGSGEGYKTAEAGIMKASQTGLFCSIVESFIRWLGSHQKRTFGVCLAVVAGEEDVDADGAQVVPIVYLNGNCESG